MKVISLALAGTVLLLFSASGAGVETVDHCDCSYHGWKGECTATIALQDGQAVIETDAKPCARVDWYRNAVPQVVIMKSGRTSLKIPLQGSTPRLTIESCKICTASTPVRPFVSENLELSQEELERLVKRYYDRRGEWSGIFTIDSVVRTKVIPDGSDRLTAHIKYHAIPVPGNRQGRTDGGYDQRIFTLVKKESGWMVTGMGGHRSAQF